jgi:hypothetical protein
MSGASPASPMTANLGSRNVGDPVDRNLGGVAKTGAFGRIDRPEELIRIIALQQDMRKDMMIALEA